MGIKVAEVGVVEGLVDHSTSDSGLWGDDPGKWKFEGFVATSAVASHQ